MSPRVFRMSAAAVLVLGAMGWAIAGPGPRPPSGGGCTNDCTFTGTTTTGAISASTIATSGAITSSVTSGNPAISLVQGARVCLTDACTFGPRVAATGANILDLAGSTVAVSGTLSVGGNATTGSGFYVRLTRSALATCAAGIEGAMMADILGGAATGNPTRMCLCRSDGSSVYAWQSLSTGATGTTTTCPN